MRAWRNCFFPVSARLIAIHEKNCSSWYWKCQDEQCNVRGTTWITVIQPLIGLKPCCLTHSWRCTYWCFPLLQIFGIKCLSYGAAGFAGKRWEITFRLLLVKCYSRRFTLRRSHQPPLSGNDNQRYFSLSSQFTSHYIIGFFCCQRKNIAGFRCKTLFSWL